MWRHGVRWISRRGRRSRGPASTRSSIKARAEKKIKWIRSRAYLTPRGDWASPIFISVKTARSPSDGHDKRRFSSHRGRRGIAHPSSHGHDDLRSLSHLGGTWKRAGRWICIARMTIVHQQARSAMIGTTTYLIAIGRRKGFVEEFHDRGAIAPRLRFDRDAIVAKINRDHGSFITESSPRCSNDVQ